MKTKITILLTALLMLVGISVNAQVKNQTPKRAETTTPIKGDVNEDGVVDIADINAVIEIMKNGGGTSGETKYYWYVGQEPPTSTSNNPNIVTGAVPGWHEIGTSIGTYTFASPLYNSEANPITSNPSKNSNWYVAFPSTSSLGVYDSADRNEVTNGNWTTEQPIIVAGITYNVYKSVGTYRNFNVWWIHTEESQTKYYWYVGTTKPTSLSQAETVSEYPTEYTFTNPSTETKCYVYVLTNTNKTVNMYDPAMPTLPLTIQTDITTINGYKITYLGTEDGPARIAKGGSVIIKVS